MAEKKRSSTKAERLKKFQKIATEEILNELEKKFLTREKIKSGILSGRAAENISDTDVLTLLDLIDAVRENVKTSLQFGKFRRATRYLTLLQTLCEKFLK